MSQNICRYFASTGNCFYGDQCNYLHVRPEQPPGNFATTSSAAAKAKSQIPCKNISLYGFCKFQGKGCEYNHDFIVQEDQNNIAQPQVPTILKRPDKPNDLTTQFQNMSFNEEPAPKNPYVNYPNYTPEGFVPQSFPAYEGTVIPTPLPIATAAVKPVQKNTQPHARPHDPNAAPGQMRGGTTYFYGSEPTPPQQTQPTSSIQYDPTASALPHTAKPGRRLLASYFMNEDLRQDLLQRNMLIYSQVGDQNRFKDLPTVVQRYHSLYPLDKPNRPTNASVFGFPTSVYKVFSSNDGLPYVIRRIEGFRLSNEHALRMVDVWKNLQHPNIVGLQELFITKDFGDVNSVFFAYNYHPGSETLEERYFQMLNADYIIPEPVLWSYVCQLVSALRTIHNANLACKVLIPSKVILTNKNKIRINCCGIHDVVGYDGGKNLPHYQHEDLVSLGRLILSLACRTPTAVHNVFKSLDFVSSRYSIELKNFLVYLLKPNNHPNLDEITSMISGKLLTEVEHLNTYTDLLESDLSKELENGRLFRLMVKLGFINERPELDMDPSWSETGDRYLLKLFRDYVFHQVYEDATPAIDFAHVVESLNKLDAGIGEKVVLMSRDEQSLLIVSYKDLKRCTEEAFGELLTRARRHPDYQ